MAPDDMDAAFSLDSVTDLPAIFAARGRAAEASLARGPVLRGLRYGAAPNETLNIFPATDPAGQAAAPVLFFIHGGFWRSLDADLFSFLAHGFAPFGAHCVIIDYPLIPQVRLAGILDACARALRWVHENIADHEGDPDGILLAGNSAGGHLVAELAAADRRLTRAAAASGSGVPITGIVPISGIFDLEPVTRSFQNDTLCLSDEEVAGLSPLRRDYRPVAPIITATGGDETAEFLRQSREFASLCRRSGQDVENLIIPDTNHITVLTEALARPEHPFNRRVRTAMGLAG